VTSDSPEQTKEIFKVLTSIPNTKVVQVKNGFQNNKDGTAFNPAEYADIKLILLIDLEGQKYQELMEVQIIQRVNVELKKLEHKP